MRACRSHSPRWLGRQDAARSPFLRFAGRCPAGPAAAKEKHDRRPTSGRLATLRFEHVELQLHAARSLVDDLACWIRQCDVPPGSVSWSFRRPGRRGHTDHQERNGHELGVPHYCSFLLLRRQNPLWFGSFLKGVLEPAIIQPVEGIRIAVRACLLRQVARSPYPDPSASVSCEPSGRAGTFPVQHRAI